MNVAAHHDGPAVPAPDIRACKAVEATTKFEIVSLMSCDEPRDDGHWSPLLKGSRSAASTCGDP